ncbi:hypothetical protein FQA47_007306 [Oryzias melastigma]|uniref:Uncharacterized protein n=1 Tax=Oryzias melastigma TaxID=30732 RepID=A0A834EZS6_ORYME|nr:hypothetical protein FQA47_007306 [Oryzias melastigma]
MLPTIPFPSDPYRPLTKPGSVLKHSTETSGSRHTRPAPLSAGRYRLLGLAHTSHPDSIIGSSVFHNTKQKKQRGSAASSTSAKRTRTQTTAAPPYIAGALTLSAPLSAASDAPHLEPANPESRGLVACYGSSRWPEPSVNDHSKDNCLDSLVPPRCHQAWSFPKVQLRSSRWTGALVRTRLTPPHPPESGRRRRRSRCGKKSRLKCRRYESGRCAHADHRLGLSDNSSLCCWVFIIVYSAEARVSVPERLSASLSVCSCVAGGNRRRFYRFSQTRWRFCSHEMTDKWNTWGQRPQNQNFS